MNRRYLSVGIVWAFALLCAGHSAPASPPEDPRAPVPVPAPLADCPFCQLAAEEIVAADGPCVAIRDAHPASPGHTLIMSRRHVASFRDLTAEEAAAIDRLARQLALELQAADPTITGFNFGVNDGVDAGQSIPHCHFHLIPRRSGDTPHPRGGIRKAISAQ